MRLHRNRRENGNLRPIIYEDRKARREHSLNKQRREQELEFQPKYTKLPLWFLGLILFALAAGITAIYLAIRFLP